jgi:hypothetical protein
MRTWFNKHPNVGFILCLIGVVVCMANLRNADTTPERLWAGFGAVTLSCWAVYWWDKS